MHLRVKKLNLHIFAHASPDKTFPQVFIFTPQTGGNHSFPRREHFSNNYLPLQKGRERKLWSCQDILSMQEVSIKDLAKRLGALSSIVLAIFPAPCTWGKSRDNKSTEITTVPDLVRLCKEERNWRISNLNLSNRRLIFSHLVEHLHSQVHQIQDGGLFLRRHQYGENVLTQNRSCT